MNPNKNTTFDTRAVTRISLVLRLVLLGSLLLARSSTRAQTTNGVYDFGTGQSQDDPASTKYAYKAVNAPKASGTRAYAINNSGTIVGYITGGECAVTSDQSTCGFVDMKGKFTTVACELDAATEFFDVSNTGEVVGVVSVVGGVAAVIWKGNEACSGLDPFGASSAQAEGVAGQDIVGFYVDGDTNYQGFLYSSKTGDYTNIACAGWTDTRAMGINAAGVIVGDVSNSVSGPFEGFIYKAGKCTVFEYPKAASTAARGINKSDQVSGWYTDTAGKTHGFVKTGDSFAALNYPRATGTLAYHLNDQGQVAGWYADTAGVNHGFVATHQAGSDVTPGETSFGDITDVKHVVPYVTLSSTSGSPSTTVNLSSRWSLYGATRVAFNGADASFTAVSEYLITATVPANVKVGYNTVEVNAPSGYEGVLYANTNFDVE